MLTPDEICTRLADRRIDLVAKATGLHYNTVRVIRDGTAKNPTYRVLRALSDYLEGREIKE